MRHIVLDRWSRGVSPMHRRDPRAKIVALLVFLVVLATAHRALPFLALAFLFILSAAFLWARLPVAGALARAMIVLPFTAVFAFVSWMAGDPERGLALVIKAYLSALAVLLVVATTPLTSLLSALEIAGVPRFLLEVIQFLYRYLFVIFEEARHMADAAASRGAASRWALWSGLRFRAAAGALAVLFTRSYERAQNVHRAMLARGYQGRFETLEASRLNPADAAFAFTGALLPVALRLAIEGAVR